MHKRLSSVAVALVLAANTWADDSRFVVKDIRLEGLMRVSPASVYAQLPVNNGDNVDDARVADAIRALFKSGNFEDVAAERDGESRLFATRVVGGNARAARLVGLPAHRLIVWAMLRRLKRSVAGADGR